MSGSSSRGGEGGRGQGSEDWADIKDPAERRRVQNRIAQRNYRVRKRTEQEEQARIAENQRAAGAAYTASEPEDLARNDNPEGLPWGSFSMRHAFEAGRAKQERSQHASREGSVAGRSADGGSGARTPTAGSGGSGAGGSGSGAGGGSSSGGGSRSRRWDPYPLPYRPYGMAHLGLQLPQSWVRGAPDWQSYWQRRPRPGRGP